FPGFAHSQVFWRRYYRRYLRRRFGFDVRAGDFLRGAVPPTHRTEGVLLCWAIREFKFHDSVFRAGLWALYTADIQHKPFAEKLSEAVEAMRRAWNDYPIFVAIGMGMEDDEMQRLATVQTSAWARTAISLKDYHGASGRRDNRLRAALERELA